MLKLFCIISNIVPSIQLVPKQPRITQNIIGNSVYTFVYTYLSRNHNDADDVSYHCLFINFVFKPIIYGCCGGYITKKGCQYVFIYILVLFLYVSRFITICVLFSCHRRNLVQCMPNKNKMSIVGRHLVRVSIKMTDCY